jgi:hypothetical protein
VERAGRGPAGNRSTATTPQQQRSGRSLSYPKQLRQDGTGLASKPGRPANKTKTTTPALPPSRFAEGDQNSVGQQVIHSRDVIAQIIRGDGLVVGGAEIGFTL